MVVYGKRMRVSVALPSQARVPWNHVCCFGGFSQVKQIPDETLTNCHRNPIVCQTYLANKYLHKIKGNGNCQYFIKLRRADVGRHVQAAVGVSSDNEGGAIVDGEVDS